MNGRKPQLHPCLPVHPAERQRLLVAAYMALHALRAGKSAQDWLDLLAAVDLARMLIADDDARAVTEAAAAALKAASAAAEARPPAGRACEVFMGIYEGLLASVSWRALEDAKAKLRRQCALALQDSRTNCQPGGTAADECD